MAEDDDDNSQEEDEDFPKKKKEQEKVFKFNEKRFTNADKRALVKYFERGIAKLEPY